MTTLNLKVAASADDAREDETPTNSINESTLGPIRSGAATRKCYAAFRWSVAIAQGTTITSATLGLYITAGSVVGQDVYCQQADNAGAFTTTATDISGRTAGTRTTLTGTPSVGSYLSFDVTSIVQTIINRAGFASGNYIAIIVDALTPGITSASAITVQAYDGSSANAAKLDIVYSGAAAGAGPMVGRQRLKSKLAGLVS